MKDLRVTVGPDGSRGIGRASKGSVRNPNQTNKSFLDCSEIRIASNFSFCRVRKSSIIGLLKPRRNGHMREMSFNLPTSFCMDKRSTSSVRDLQIAAIALSFFSLGRDQLRSDESNHIPSTLPAVTLENAFSNFGQSDAIWMFSCLHKDE